jgi:hypothetical protein
MPRVNPNPILKTEKPGNYLSPNAVVFLVSRAVSPIESVHAEKLSSGISLLIRSSGIRRQLSQSQWCTYGGHISKLFGPICSFYPQVQHQVVGDYGQ